MQTLLPSLWQDLRYAIRQLRHSSGFALTAIATLALGIGVNVVVFSVLNALVLQPMNYPNARQVYALQHSGENGTAALANSYPDYSDLRDRNATFSNLAMYRFAHIGLQTCSWPATADRVRSNFRDVWRPKSRIFQADCSWIWECDSARHLHLEPSHAATVALAVFGCLGILLAVTGIFGLASYTVSRRMKELGIRIALGASRGQILRAALQRPIILLAFGSLAGLVSGVLASRILASIVYQATSQRPAGADRCHPDHAAGGGAGHLDSCTPHFPCRPDKYIARRIESTRKWDRSHSTLANLANAG